MTMDTCPTCVFVYKMDIRVSVIGKSMHVVLFSNLIIINNSYHLLSPSYVLGST